MIAPTEILFFRWVTLTEQKWVTFRERRSDGAKGLCYGAEFNGSTNLKTAVSQQRWRSEEHFQGLFLAERHERRH